MEPHGPLEPDDPLFWRKFALAWTKLIVWVLVLVLLYFAGGSIFTGLALGLYATWLFLRSGGQSDPILFFVLLPIMIGWWIWGAKRYKLPTQNKGTLTPPSAQ